MHASESLSVSPEGYTSTTLPSSKSCHQTYASGSAHISTDSHGSLKEEHVQVFEANAKESCRSGTMLKSIVDEIIAAVPKINPLDCTAHTSMETSVTISNS